MRIEKCYLGYNHPNLSPALFSISQIHKKHNVLTKAKQYFIDTLSLLIKHSRKGQLHASLICNIVLIEYRLSFCKDTLENFDIAATEYYAMHGDSHPSIAEIRVQVGNV